MGVVRPVGKHDGVRRGEKVVRDVRHLEVRRRDREAAVMGDAHLEVGAPVIA